MMLCIVSKWQNLERRIVKLIKDTIYFSLLSFSLEQLLLKPVFGNSIKIPLPLVSLFFSPVNAVERQTPVLVFHTTESAS